MSERSCDEFHFAYKPTSKLIFQSLTEQNRTSLQIIELHLLYIEVFVYFPRT